MSSGHHAIFRCTLALLSSYTFSLPAQAVDAAVHADAGTELSFFEELPIVLAATRLPQSLHDAPGAVMLLDRSDIVLSGARDLPDLLRLMPGFQVWRDASFPVVSYHGGTRNRSQRLQVLLNGRSLFTQTAEGGVDWSLLGISLDDVDRVEIFRGTNAATYGSDSQLGVVNIITRPLEDTRGGLVSAQVGEFGVRDGTVRVGGAWQDLDWRVTASHRSDHGHAPGTDSRTGEVFQHFDPHELTQVRAQSRLQVSNSDSVDVVLAHSEGRRGDGQVLPVYVLNPARWESLGADHAHVVWQRRLEADHEYRISVGHGRDHIMGMQALTIGTLGTVFDLQRLTSREYVHFDALRPLDMNWRAAYGLQWRREKSRSPFYLGSPAYFDIETARAYGNVEWRVSPIVLVNAGATAEHDSGTGMHLSPRLVVNWTLTPGHTLRTGVSLAHRQPSTWERDADLKINIGAQLLDYRFQSTNALRPEALRAWELSYVGVWPQARMRADVRAFHELSRNFITSYSRPYQGPSAELMDKTHSVVDFTNGGRSSSQGVEWYLTWQPLAGARLAWSQTWQDIRANMGQGDAYDRLYERSAPKRQSALMAAYEWSSGLAVSMNYQYLSKMSWLDATADLPPLRRVDWRVGQSFHLGSATAVAALVMRSANGDILDGSPSQRMRRALSASLTVSY